MRPRILHELSRRLAILLEEGIRGEGAVPRVPVFLCHPHDPLEGLDESAADAESNAAAILYPVRISPEPRFRRAGMEWEPRGQGRPRDLLRLQNLWLKVRYVLLVAGGTLELELEILAAALQTLHDHPSITLEPEIEPRDEAGEREDGAAEGGVFPVQIIDPADGWRELGLEDHRLLVSFEVTLPIRSRLTEAVGPVLERELSVEGGDR